VELSDDEVARAKFALAEAARKSTDEIEGLIRDSDRYVTRKFVEIEEMIGVRSRNPNRDYLSDEDISKYVELYKRTLFEERGECDVRKNPYQWLLRNMGLTAARARNLDSVILCWACAVFSCKHRPHLGSIIAYIAHDLYDKDDSEIINSPNYGYLNELTMIRENNNFMRHVHNRRDLEDVLGKAFYEVMEDKIRFIDKKGQAQAPKDC
jgi:hypothetical protein